MIALIHPNNFIPSDISEINFTEEIIKDQIETYIEFVPLSQNSLSDTIIEQLKPERGFLIHTEKCYQDENYSYQLCHMNANDKEKNNRIGKILNDEIADIRGNIILMKFEYSLDKYEIVKITLDDIINILQQTLLRTGIVITPNDDVDEFHFKLNPFEWMSETEIKNLTYFEIEIFEMVIYIYIQKKPENNKLNNIASALLHENNIPINGNVYLVLTNINGCFYPFHKETFMKLVALMSCKDFNRKLNEEETNYKNSFIVINNRFKEYKKNHSEKYIRFEITNPKTLNEIANETS
jgi:hypothetical protein